MRIRAHQKVFDASLTHECCLELVALDLYDASLQLVLQRTAGVHVLLLLLLLEQSGSSVHRVEDDSLDASLVRELVYELVACVSGVCIHVDKVHVVVAVMFSGTL